MIAYIRNLFDRRTPEEKARDGVRKAVAEYEKNAQQVKHSRLRIMKTTLPERQHSFDKITNP